MIQNEVLAQNQLVTTATRLTNSITVRDAIIAASSILSLKLNEEYFSGFCINFHDQDIVVIRDSEGTSTTKIVNTDFSVAIGKDELRFRSIPTILERIGEAVLSEDSDMFALKMIFDYKCSCIDLAYQFHSFGGNESIKDYNLLLVIPGLTLSIEKWKSLNKETAAHED